MNTDEKNLKTVVVPFESLGWGLLPSYRRWGFFRKWTEFIKDSQATVLENIAMHEVRMYNEFIEERFFENGGELTTSIITKVEKVFYFEGRKGMIPRFLGWLLWPRREEGSLRFTIENGDVVTVPFERISRGTIFNMRAVRWGANDELMMEP